MHVPQAKHVGCRLETLNETHSSSEQSATKKICNRVGQIQLKMDLASDTMWTLNGITLIAYMHIWLVEFQGYFA